jgi:predicted dehydrogenase
LQLIVCLACEYLDRIDVNAPAHVHSSRSSAIGEPHARECMAFAEAIANDLPSPIAAEQSLHVMSILDGLYRSAASGKEVFLNGILD